MKSFRKKCFKAIGLITLQLRQQQRGDTPLKHVFVIYIRVTTYDVGVFMDVELGSLRIYATQIYTTNLLRFYRGEGDWI